MLLKNKTLVKFVLKSFAGPFILTFFISLFILLMQFVWKYIDDMIGKGIEWYIISELLLYTSASLVPLALPLAILLASLMTFGNMGEHYELVAFKAAGISLQRVMKPLIITMVFISISAFLFSNYILPIANLKAGTLLYDVRQKKPAVNILPNRFYDEIEGIVIRVKNKSHDDLENKDLLEDILIYDHSEGQGNRKVTIAESGEMKLVDNENFLSIKLFNGSSYEEKFEKTRDKTFPLTRSEFKENEVLIDLSAFKMNRSDEEIFKDDYRMLNLGQLSHKIDTLKGIWDERKKEFTQNMKTSYLFYVDSNDIASKNLPLQPLNKPFDQYIAQLDLKDLHQVYATALNYSRTNKSRCEALELEAKGREDYILFHEIEWHRKLTLSLACLVMFFIGAPLGAIIRKGGLGMPVVVSVIFFLLFWVLSITGEKMAKEGIVSPLEGMWMSSVILLPLGVFFMYKATTDSTLFNIDAYIVFFTKLFKKNKSISVE